MKNKSKEIDEKVCDNGSKCSALAYGDRPRLPEKSTGLTKTVWLSPTHASQFQQIVIVNWLTMSRVFIHKKIKVQTNLRGDLYRAKKTTKVY